MADRDILFSRHGGRGHILINRPEALNAITRDMLLRMEDSLEAWRDDDGVAVVTIQGAGGRAFAAGGDMRALYEAGRLDGSLNYPFYADEYRVNARIKRYPKPYVAFIDGIVMGGGAGLSVHGSHRVAGDRTLFAMPETGIGLFPDVGGSYFLPRLPGQIGMYLGLTGSSLKAADCLYAGLADSFLPSDSIAEAAKSLDGVAWTGDREAADAEVGERLAMFQGAPGSASLASDRERIDETFSAESLSELMRNLAADDDWRRRQKAKLDSKSPTSLRATFRLLRTGERLSFEACMRMEYRLARAFMNGHDFYEGARATIIDKDGAPKWRPATLAEMSDASLEAIFAPLGEDDLAL